MRKLKSYFHLIVTAVICFFMSLIPGKKGSENVKKVLVGGQAVRNHNRCNAETTSVKIMPIFMDYKGGRTAKSAEDYLKKNFFWMQGPGDREKFPYPMPYG